MAQRFVIDININGAEGASTQGRAGQNTGMGMAAGVLSGGLVKAGQFKGSLSPKTGTGKGAGYAVPYKDESWYSQKRWDIEDMEDGGWGGYGGKLHNFGTRRTVGGEGLVPDGVQEQETRFGAGLRHTGSYMQAHQKELKMLGKAAVWKAARVATDLQNYKSGDSYANAQRNNAMKMATMGTALAALGPWGLAAFAANEAVDYFVDKEKYSFDRKMETQEIYNIKQIAGDVSYGINRRGGY